MGGKMMLVMVRMSDFQWVLVFAAATKVEMFVGRRLLAFRHLCLLRNAALTISKKHLVAMGDVGPLNDFFKQLYTATVSYAHL